MLGYLSHLKGERSQASNHLKEAIRVLEEAGMTVDASNQSIESLRVFEKTIREDSDKALPEESLKLMLQVMNWKGLKFMLQLRSDTLLSEEVDFILDATTADAKEKKQLPLKKISRYYRDLLNRCWEESDINAIDSFQHEGASIAAERWWAYLQRSTHNYAQALHHINKVLDVDRDDIDARLREVGFIED